MSIKACGEYALGQVPNTRRGSDAGLLRQVIGNSVTNYCLAAGSINVPAPSSCSQSTTTMLMKCRRVHFLPVTVVCSVRLLKLPIKRSLFPRASMPVSISTGTLPQAAQITTKQILKRRKAQILRKQQTAAIEIPSLTSRYVRSCLNRCFSQQKGHHSIFLVDSLGVTHIISLELSLCKCGYFFFNDKNGLFLAERCIARSKSCLLQVIGRSMSVVLRASSQKQKTQWVGDLRAAVNMTRQLKRRRWVTIGAVFMRQG